MKTLKYEEVYRQEYRDLADARASVSVTWAWPGVDRGSYRYEPRPDRNGPLREALVSLARQKPRYGYRRLHALLERGEHPASVMRIYRLYRAEGLAVRRLKRKRLSRVAVASHLVRSNQEWALDFACDTLATGRAPFAWPSTGKSLRGFCTMTNMR